MKAGWEIKTLGEVCVMDKKQGIHKNLPSRFPFQINTSLKCRNIFEFIPNLQRKLEFHLRAVFS